METIKLAIAENDIFFRLALIYDLSLLRDIKIVACVSNGVELLNLIKQEEVDLAVIYAYLPHLSGIETAKLLRKNNAVVKFLVYTTTYQQDIYELLLSLRSDGYCGKDAGAIAAAVHSIAIDEKAFFPAEYLSGWKSKSIEIVEPVSPEKFSRLKPVDVKILGFVCEGKSNKEIAAQLNLSMRTIDAYLIRIFETLDVSNRVELVQFAFVNGICAKNCINMKSGICIRRTIF